MKKDAGELKQKAKKDFDEKAKDIAAKREDFEKKLAELKNSEMWMQLKAGLTAAWSELKKSFEAASKHVDSAKATDAKSETNPKTETKPKTAKPEAKPDDTKDRSKSDPQAATSEKPKS